MKTTNYFNTAFKIGMFLTILGALFKMQHFPTANIILIVGLFATLVYIIIGIYEVNNSKKITTFEKFIYTIGFITFGFFTGIYYYFIGRKNII